MSAQDRSLSPEVEGSAPGRERLKGKRVLVVGAGTRPVEGSGGALGNGRAISILAAREGARVACADRSEEAASVTVEMIETEGGLAHPLVVDVGEPEACRDLITDAVDVLGGLDGLVLSVGILAPFGLLGTSAEEWDRVFAVNARSHALLAGQALEAMDAGGALVFMSSISGLMPGLGMPAYDATKAAVLALSRQTALEGAPLGIRANSVLPGVVDTPLGAATPRPDGPERDRLKIPLGRRGTPWDVACATVFLLSPESDYVTSQSLVVDGGLTSLMLGG